MPEAYDPKKNGIGKVPAYTLLKKGDPWTFMDVTDEQLAVAHRLYELNRPTSRWFNTGEAGRLFQITRIHDEKRVIETTYLGFQEQPGSDNAG